MKYNYYHTPPSHIECRDGQKQNKKITVMFEQINLSPQTTVNQNQLKPTPSTLTQNTLISHHNETGQSEQVMFHQSSIIQSHYLHLPS